MTDIVPVNQLLLLVLLLPFAVVFGGWFAWRVVVILIGLGLLFTYPLAGALYLIVLAAWRPIKIFVAFLIGGYAAGWGFGRATRPRYPRRRRWSARELNRYDDEMRRSAPRLRGRRVADYNPWPRDEFDV
jgi:uncharacterized membrane protein YccC